MKYSTKDNAVYVSHGTIKTSVYTINDMPAEERPREKLLAYGPGALSVRELLTILIEKGTKKEGVMSMVDRVLQEYGERSLRDLRDPQHLADELGIPITRAYTLAACAELGRRFYAHPKGVVTIRTPEDVFAATKDMQGLQKEQVRGLYLNAHHQVIHDEVISIGTANSSVIHPREVFRPALVSGAVAVVIAHNHPSGNPVPSEADKHITAQLQAAGQMLGIELLDHVIVGSDAFVSLIRGDQ